MQFALAAIHLAFQRRIDGTLLLHAVQATKALVDPLCRVVISIACKVGNGNFPFGKLSFRSVSSSSTEMAMVWSLSNLLGK